MGFLASGNTLAWSDAKKVAAYIQEHGVEQFLSMFRRTKDRTNDVLAWGDEVSAIYHRIVTMLLSAAKTFCFFCSV